MPYLLIPPNTRRRLLPCICGVLIASLTVGVVLFAAQRVSISGPDASPVTDADDDTAAADAGVESSPLQRSQDVEGRPIGALRLGGAYYPLAAKDLFPVSYGRVAKGSTRPPFDESASLKRINPIHPFFAKKVEWSSRSPLPSDATGDENTMKSPWVVEERENARRAEEEVGYKCPPFRFPGGKSADSKTMQEAASKYTRYTRQYCNSTGLLQMSVPLETYVGMLDKIAQLVHMKPNDRLFDWGSGCGTMLNYYHLTHNTTGVGIDLTPEAVQHAMGHRQPQQLFCNMNGANLNSFPNASFDAVVSWATLYHVRRTLVQCDIVHNLVRMLKPGGRAFVGHLRTEKTQDYWKNGDRKCKVPGATMTRYRDFRMFHQTQWRKHGFFSLLVHKVGDGASNFSKGGPSLPAASTVVD